MNGPRLANIIVLALLGFFAVAFLPTAIMNSRQASLHANRENERRLRSFGASSDTGRPEWLRYMDRDSDGRLSRKEFVGTDEQFRRIDSDGDHFISVSEAWAMDEWFRNQVP